MIQPDQLPIVRLLPKINAQKLRFGFPWVYRDQVVLDRRTRNIPAGAVVILQDSNRQVLGQYAFNATSQIICRLLEADTSNLVGSDWLRKRLQRALDLRERLFEQPYYRLVHAEADGLPGVVVDRFGPVAVVQPNTAFANARMAEISDALTSVTGVTTVIKNCSGRSRALEGLDDKSAVLTGEITGPMPVQMNGATYLADVTGGQKTGLFYDQRPNHAFAARLAEGASVLDVFCHVGGFGLAALAAGATSALGVDSSAASLGLAEKGAVASGYGDCFSTRRGDAFKVMEELQKEAEQFDLVVCDPPAFAPNRAALNAGLRAYSRVARQAAELVSPGGFLGLCSCSHAASLDSFREACTAGIGKAGRRGQLIYTGAAGPDHPTHPMLAESSYLKALFFRLD